MKDAIKHSSVFLVCDIGVLNSDYLRTPRDSLIPPDLWNKNSDKCFSVCITHDSIYETVDSAKCDHQNKQQSTHSPLEDEGLCSSTLYIRY